MNKISLAASLLFLPQISYCAIAHVQSSANGATGSGTSINIALPGNAVAGNMAVVGWRYSGGGDVVTLSGGGNSYTSNEVQAIDANDANATVGVGYALNIAGGALTVAVATVGSNTKRLAISEFSGVATSAAADKESGTNGVGTAVACGAVTPTTNGQLFFATMQNAANATVTAGTDFTERTAIPTNDGNQRAGTESYIQPTAASHDFTFTQGANQSWACAGVTFKEAAAGAAPILNTRTIIQGGAVLQGRAVIQ